MSTTSTASSIGGIQSYEEYQEQSLYATEESSALGKDTFLLLLTTQLQHQDPLNPMDNSQFVAQLSQFSSLEQLTASNENLENLLVGVTSVSNASMVGMIGNEVRAIGGGFHYEEGTKPLYYNLESSADQLTVSIYDKDGSLVNQETLENIAGGDQLYTWNGMTDKGTPAKPGDYYFQISATNGASGVSAITYTQGMVDQIDFSTGVAAPRIDGQNITVDKIVQIYEPEDAGG